ncbi:MAG: DegT/DnrJ/EryC1/StrS family aminotransferase [Planctomycetota bacterium]|nr:DegT/DnrJ/EryC1/StrS family aminotransferase [Planctomycetota bacterium]
MPALDTREKLAAFGGPKAIARHDPDLFDWPIVTAEDEQAVLEVLRRKAMSGTDVTQQFEREIAAFHGRKFALAHPNGTSALHMAMHGCGVGPGDEIISPSFTFWATCTQALSLGAKIVFAESRPDTLNLDPADIEHRITKRTKAITVVHYCGYPADMDPLLEIANRHGLKVIEDVSHAHGGHYKGRLVGSIGHAAGMSMMAGKALAIGEAGMLLTDDRQVFERAVAFGHYERTRPGTKYCDEPCLTDPDLMKYAGIPMGGVKYRLQQLASAMGRVQLKHYPARLAALQAAMNRFWDLVEAEIPDGVTAHRPPQGSGSDCGGWYFPRGLYDPSKMRGVPASRFCELLNKEGFHAAAGANEPLHLHPLFKDAGCKIEPLPVTESLPGRCFGVPWFKHDHPERIAVYANALIKVARAVRAGEAS